MNKIIKNYLTKFETTLKHQFNRKLQTKNKILAPSFGFFMCPPDYFHAHS